MSKLMRGGVLAIAAGLAWPAVSSGAPLFTAVPVSDANTDNSIAFPNTARKVATGPDGTIYVTYYGLTGGTRVARSTNRGQSFQASVQLTALSLECEIAVDRNGVVHVAGVDSDHVLYTRSTDGGQNFAPMESIADLAAISVHMSVDAPFVYLVPRSGEAVLVNGASGVGAFTSTPLGGFEVFSDIHTDPTNGQVFVQTDDPGLMYANSTDHGATFTPLTPIAASIFYSTAVFANTPNGRFMYTGGDGDSGVRVNVDDLSFVELTLGVTTDFQGRCLAVDAFNNMVDAYVSAPNVVYHISTDNGATFGPEVTVAEAQFISVAINRFYGDLVVVYQAAGEIFASVYESEVTQAPNVITAEVSDVTGTSANCGGNVTSSGGLEVTGRGVCWSTSPTPTIADAHTTDGVGTGEYTSALTGLSINTTYFVRAYATNSLGTGYGEVKSFSTSSAEYVVVKRVVFPWPICGVPSFAPMAVMLVTLAGWKYRRR